MFLDYSVIRVNEDGSKVLTSEVQEGDDLLGTTVEAQAEQQIPISDRGDWVRTDADPISAPAIPTSVEPIVIDKAYPTRPADDDPKSVWWNYAKELGYGGEDYDHITRAQLIRLYGDLKPNAAQPDADA